MRDSILIVEVVDGPYRGEITRIGARAAFAMVRPWRSTDVLEPYRVERLEGGDVVLRHIRAYDG